jgi:hypothetical protein
MIAGRVQLRLMRFPHNSRLSVIKSNPSGFARPRLIILGTAVPVRMSIVPERATVGYARGDLPVASNPQKISHNKHHFNAEVLAIVYRILGKLLTWITD